MSCKEKGNLTSKKPTRICSVVTVVLQWQSCLVFLYLVCLQVLLCYPKLNRALALERGPQLQDNRERALFGFRAMFSSKSKLFLFSFSFLFSLSPLHMQIRQIAPSLIIAGQYPILPSSLIILVMKNDVGWNGMHQSNISVCNLQIYL